MQADHGNTVWLKKFKDAHAVYGCKYCAYTVGVNPYSEDRKLIYLDAGDERAKHFTSVSAEVIAAAFGLELWPKTGMEEVDRFVSSQMRFDMPNANLAVDDENEPASEPQVVH